MEDEFAFQEKIDRRIACERLARKILGVDENAGEKEIKKAFWLFAMKYHPDKNPGDDEAFRKFKNALNAYEFLKGNADESVLSDENEPSEETIGGYHANDWGFFCHWRDRFMDVFDTGDNDTDATLDNDKR